MLGIEPEAWSLTDIISLQIFQAWSNGSNWKMDLLSQQLVDELGPQRAQEIAQVSINPDDESITTARLSKAIFSNPANTDSNAARLNLKIDPSLMAAIPDPIIYGSNAWATGNHKSLNGKPIFANSPHLPATTLPGFWHPIGLFTPKLRAVGVAAAGSPGISVGRTEHIAYGATVGGSDGADVYIEQLDPDKEDHYFEGESSKPFTIRNEIIKIKDGDIEGGLRELTLKIRSTKRGPLISDHGIGFETDSQTNRAISLRWAAFSSTPKSMGSDRLLVAKNLDQARQALKHSPVALSHIVVDRAGGIGRISSGRVPIRLIGDGALPLPVSALEAVQYEPWSGLINYADMPSNINPKNNWVGTANHRIIGEKFPYQFSKIFAASWRYRRIKNVMEQNGEMDVSDHWNLINDVYNPMAEKIVPAVLAVIADNPGLQRYTKTLIDWDFKDDKDQVAPTLFHSFYKHLVELTFKDELSEALWLQFIDAPYFWQERLLLMLEENENIWFDDRTTQKIESRDNIILQAIHASVSELEQSLGSDRKNWQWGKIHTITFASPVIPGKLAARFLGHGTHAMQGSGETLNRGAYKLRDAYNTTVVDSVRLVADMSDPDKILAVIPGGTSGRYFDNSLSNQVDDWLKGKSNPLWFSREAIKKHAVSELVLTPE